MRNVNFGLLTGGVLHSKFWIVDRKHVFIGSANMDWRAITQVKLDTSNETEVLLCLTMDFSALCDITKGIFPLKKKQFFELI